MDKNKRKLTEISECKIFYSAEAFLRSENGYIPMEHFAPALLDAKNEEEIENILKEYHFEHSTYTPLSVMYHTDEDSIPSYASWMLHWLRTMNAYKDLYFICLPIVHGDSIKSATEDLFDVLFYAQKLCQQMHSEAQGVFEWIKPQDFRERQIKEELRGNPEFPLVELFEKFQETNGAELQRKYSVPYHRTAKGEHYEHHYWRNVNIAAKARRELQDYARAHPSKGVQHIIKPNPKEIASMYLKILDEHFNGMMLLVDFELDSISGKAIHSTPNIEAAMFLWIFTQIQGQVKYRACRLCGKLFPLGSQDTKLYCGSHTGSEIQYFNNKVRKKEQEIADAEEKAECFAV